MFAWPVALSTSVPPVVRCSTLPDEVGEDFLKVGAQLTGRSMEIDAVSKRYGKIVAWTASPTTCAQASSSLSSAATARGRPRPCASRWGCWGAGGAGVLTADSGEVRFDRKTISHQTRTQIGYVPEERGRDPKMNALDQFVYLAKLHGLTAN
jgi:ABC-2 type transport system ATP-binding protein